MTHVRTLAKPFFALVALIAVTAAFAQTSDTTATVAATNSLTMQTGTGQTIGMSPTVGNPVTDKSTVLDYKTNDGQTYKIQVAAAAEGWTFTPSVTGTAANTYPALTVDSVSADDGTPGSGTIIAAADNTITTVDVLTGLTNVAGSATVTLGASVTQTVVAGGYNTTLTYTFVSP